MNQIKKKLKYGLLAFLVLPFFLGGISNATDGNGGGDLLWKVWEISDNADTVIDVGDNVGKVGKKVVGDGSQQLIGGAKGNMLTKITKILLGLVIALSVTMILYNGMMYIIQTGQGKEGKDMMKNIIFIVIGIVIALFSTIIITLIQSVSKSIEADLNQNSFEQDVNVFK